MYRADAGVADCLVAAGDAIEDCASELALVGELLHAEGIRLSFHLHNALVLNSPNEDQAWQAARRVIALARILDALALSREAVIVVHLGGVYGDAEKAESRFVARYEALPRFARDRLCLENDGRRFSHQDLHRVYKACGIPLVFDYLHHRVLNPERVPVCEAVSRSLASWPPGVTPKVHFATPRTEVRGLGTMARLKMPTWTEHSDMVSPFEFADFCRLTADLGAFDVMLEAKARDLALLRLRQDLQRYAPEVAGLCH